MFLGWYDPDKARPTRSKVEDAIIRYRDKFGGEPDTLLCSPDDALDLPAEGVGGVYARARDFIPRNTFYVGVEDPPSPD